MVEIPEDILNQDIEDSRVENYKKIKFARSMASNDEITNISKIILSAKNPIIIAGAGVLYAEATRELAEFAELLQIPVMTTMEGKSSISERNHPLALGSGSGVMSDPVVHFMKKSDVVIALGTSLTKHPLSLIHI